MTAVQSDHGGWREQILRHFTRELSHLCPVTVVQDPDGLFGESGIVEALKAAGFTVWTFDDPLALRLVYEQSFRATRSEQEPQAFVIAVPSDAAVVPFDLLQAARESGRVIDCGISQVFPTLSPRIVREIDRSQYSALSNAQRTFQPGVLGENATTEFALRHLFRIAPELITSDVDLLKALLSLHFNAHDLPRVMADRLVALLEPRFNQWPLGILIRSAPTFWRFLDERWPVFVKRSVGERARCGDLTTAVAGPVDLPFDHPDVRAYLDNLFLDGRLTRRCVVSREDLPQVWMAVGLQADEPEIDAEIRIAELTQSVRGRLPSVGDFYQHWLSFARLWAEWLVARHQLTPTQLAEMGVDVDVLHDQVEQHFGEWLIAHYAALPNVSHWPRPIMVHHIGRYLAHHAEQLLPERRRIALVVVDGLALDQWLLVRDQILADVGTTCETEESAAFAWIPTLTSISRQAIFAAEAPFAFGSSLWTTAKEEAWWRRLWEDRGIERRQVAFVKQRDHEPDGDLFQRAKEEIENPGRFRIGVVINTLDAALHAAAVETGWLHAMVRKWQSDGHLRKLIATLVAHEFEVHITADHGNIEARGIGRPDVGDVPEFRASRAYAFPDVHTRHDQAIKFPDTIEWDGAGLPPGFFTLIASKRGAFVDRGARAVTHGGMAVEEVIVPFISIMRRKA